MLSKYTNSLKLMLETLMGMSEDKAQYASTIMLVDMAGFVRTSDVYGGEGYLLRSPCLQDFPVSKAKVTGNDSCPRLRPLVCEMLALHPKAPDEILVHHMVEHISRSEALLKRLVDTMNAKCMKEAYTSRGVYIKLNTVVK